MALDNKVIWTMWYQGYDTAPEIVKLCLESWRRFHPDWKVIALDKDALTDYLDLSRYVDVSREDLTVQKISAISRLCLLKDYGGVWTDATVFCCQPLEQWLPDYFETHFFAFRNPGRDRFMSNWFIAAEPDSVILQTLHREFLAYWTGNSFSNQNTAFGKYVTHKLSLLLKKNPQTTLHWFSFLIRKLLRVYPYFIFHYTFNKIILTDERCRDDWSRGKPFEAKGPHRLQIEQKRSNDAQLALADIEQGRSPVYKLDWRVDATSAYWRTVLDRLSALLPES